MLKSTYCICLTDYRPTFEDIKNELELFKQELINSNKINEKLPKLDQKSIGQTKEKLRSIQDLVNGYLKDDDIWEQMVKAKLQKRLQDYDDQHNDWAHKQAQMNAMANRGGGGNGYNDNDNHLNLYNGPSNDLSQTQSTYYDPNRHNVSTNNNGHHPLHPQNSNTYITTQDQQQQINVLSRMNVSNKRISLEHQSPPLQSQNEPKKSKVKFALSDDIPNKERVGSIPYNTNEESQTASHRQILPLIATDSLSMNGNSQIFTTSHPSGAAGGLHHNADVSVSINTTDLQQTHQQHNNTQSIQYHHRNTSSKAAGNTSIHLNDSQSNNILNNNNKPSQNNNSRNLNDIDEDHVAINTDNDNNLTILNMESKSNQSTNDNNGAHNLGNSVQIEDFANPPPQSSNQINKPALTNEESEVP